jgi:hypothetical protein
VPVKVQEQVQVQVHAAKEPGAGCRRPQRLRVASPSVCAASHISRLHARGNKTNIQMPHTKKSKVKYKDEDKTKQDKQRQRPKDREPKTKTQTQDKQRHKDDYIEQKKTKTQSKK